MSNVYYDPDEFDLRIIGEVNWSDGMYQFDLTVIWQRVSDGAFFWAQDSGCSCPSPFEEHTIEGLQPLSSLEECKKMLEAANASDFSLDRSPEIVDLLSRLHGAGLR